MKGKEQRELQGENERADRNKGRTEAEHCGSCRGCVGGELVELGMQV
jgi:hypothetical protein